MCCKLHNNLWFIKHKELGLLWNPKGLWELDRKHRSKNILILWLTVDNINVSILREISYHHVYWPSYSFTVDTWKNQFSKHASPEPQPSQNSWCLFRAGLREEEDAAPVSEGCSTPNPVGCVFREEDVEMAFGKQGEAALPGDEGKQSRERSLCRSCGHTSGYFTSPRMRFHIVLVEG